MLSGRRLDLIDPSPFDIEIEDIAHVLAFQARWNGQTVGDFPFSVACHSVLVMNIFMNEFPNSTNQERLTALLHDSPEFVIGDMISPVKSFLGVEYTNLEKSLLRAVHLRFGLPVVSSNQLLKKIKVADKKAAWIEATSIAGFKDTEANRIFLKPNKDLLDTLKIKLINPLKSREKFLHTFQALVSDI